MNVAAHDRRVVLSTLWIVALFNYLYADFCNSVFNTAAMTRIASGMSEGVILGWVAFMEIAIAMILLSRVLKYRWNRWANIIAAILNTVSVAWTLSGGVSRAYYGFFAAVEIGCTLFIVWYAWTWRPQAEGAA